MMYCRLERGRRALGAEEVNVTRFFHSFSIIALKLLQIVLDLLKHFYQYLTLDSHRFV